MAWKLTSWGQTRMPLTGVPWRDLSDAEFAAAEERYPELRERGYFEPADAEAEATEPARNLEVFLDVTDEDGEGGDD